MGEIRNEKGQFVHSIGKPKGARHMSTLLREAITKVIDEKGNTMDKQIIKVLAMKAKRGDLKAIDMVLDRIDGKVEQAIDLTSGGETLGMTPEQRSKLDSLLDNA